MEKRVEAVEVHPSFLTPVRDKRKRERELLKRMKPYSLHFLVMPEVGQHT